MFIKLAIDPGKSGALAVSLAGKVTTYNCPDTQKEIVELVKEMRSLANINEATICGVIEKVWSMTGQGVKSVWTFSANYATWQTALMACDIPFEEWAPQKWMKLLGGCPKDKKDRKNYIKDQMQKLHPDIKVTLKNADALALLHVWEKSA